MKLTVSILTQHFFMYNLKLIFLFENLVFRCLRQYKWNLVVLESYKNLLNYLKCNMGCEWYLVTPTVSIIDDDDRPRLK